jgi:hypothetical protein
MNNKCKFLIKGFNKLKCTKQTKEITWSECKNCEYKDYKEITSANKCKQLLKSTTPLKAKKPIKKVSKNRVSVTKQVYEYVYTRDKGKCVICGSNELIQLHHINGRSKTKTNDVNNCVMLCSNCHHNVVHASNKYWRQKLNEFISDINKLSQ